MSATATSTTASPPPNIYADPTFRERIFAQLPGNSLVAAVARNRITAEHTILLPHELPQRAGGCGSFAGLAWIISNSSMWMDYAYIRDRALKILCWGDEALAKATPIMFEQSHRYAWNQVLPPCMNFLFTTKPDDFIDKVITKSDKVHWTRIEPAPLLHSYDESPYFYLQVGGRAWMTQSRGKHYDLSWMVQDGLRETGALNTAKPQTDLERAAMMQARANRIAAEENLLALQQQRIEIAKRVGQAQKDLAIAETRWRQAEGR